MTKYLIIILLIAFYSTMANSGSEDSYNKTKDSKKIAWMDKGKAAAKAKLKDPNSAEFRNVYFHRGSDGIPMTCGEVNSRNSFGGYSGYQKFVSGGKPDLTFLEEQVADFNVIWARFCK